MELHLLKKGHKVGLAGGGTAEILAESEDGRWIKLRYLELDGEDDSSLSLIGTEDLAEADEIESILGVAHPSEWPDAVTVHVHHVPESQDYEAGYEALTMRGVPFGVSVSASGVSAQEALERLEVALRVFGFEGTLKVEDHAHIGEAQRYELPPR